MREISMNPATRGQIARDGRPGIGGVKVDFWCSDRQEAIAAQQALMRDTAARKMT